MSVNNYDHKSIQMRRGTSAEWREFGDKCVPLEAEICVELMQNPDGTVNKYVGVKVGNGIDSYAQLPYVILNEETDPIFTSHPAFNITQEDIDSWNQSELKAGEKEGELTRWDGYAWVPTDRILISYPEGIRANYDLYPIKDLAWNLGLETNRWANIWGNDFHGTGDLEIGGNVDIGGDIDLHGNISIDGGISIGNEIVDVDDFMRKSATNIVTDNWRIVKVSDTDELVMALGDRGLIVQAMYSQDGMYVGGEGKMPGDIPIDSDEEFTGQNYGLTAKRINASKYLCTRLIQSPEQSSDLKLESKIRVSIKPRLYVDQGVYAEFFEGDGSNITGIVTDQLDDVQTDGANRDDFLIYNGSGQWVAQPFYLDTELNFMGSWDLTTPPPSNPTRGDLYINDTDGVMHSGWGPLAGTNVLVGNMVGWSEAQGRWYLLGDVASGAVVQVVEGDCIVVDETQPDRPVVGLTQECQDNIQLGVEAHSWGNHADFGYATEDYVDSAGFLKAITAGTAIIVDPTNNPTEPKVSVSLGTGASDAAAGNHLHPQYLQQEDISDLEDQVEKNTQDILGLGIQVDKNVDDIKDLQNAPGVDLTGYATETWVSSNFDKYSHWNCTANGGSTTQIGSKATLDFRGSGGTTVTKAGNTITINSTSGSTDLSAYYTKTESDGRYQPKGSYATESWVSTNYQPKGSYLTSETDPTVPAHVKSITQADITKWNNPPTGGGGDNYSHWRLQASGGTTTNIGSNALVNFTGTGGCSVTRNGNIISIYAPTSSGGGTDLSNYYTKSEVDSLLNNKQATLRAGNGISLNADYVALTGKYTGAFTASGDITAFGSVSREGEAGETGEEGQDIISVLMNEIESLKARVAELEA